TTRYDHDGAGRVVAEHSPLGIVTRHTYDAFGNEIGTTFAAGTADERSVSAEFNKKNERTADVDALGNRTTYTLDAVGNRIAVTDPLGRVTHAYSNTRTKQIAAVDANGYLPTFARASAGTLASPVLYFTKPVSLPADPQTAPPPPRGIRRTTTNEYDGAGNLVRTVEPDGMSEEDVYDSSAKLITRT